MLLRPTGLAALIKFMCSAGGIDSALRAPPLRGRLRCAATFSFALLSRRTEGFSSNPPCPQYTKQYPDKRGIVLCMAEREGFEPSELVRVHLISNQARSASSGTSPKRSHSIRITQKFSNLIHPLMLLPALNTPNRHSFDSPAPPVISHNATSPLRHRLHQRGPGYLPQRPYCHAQSANNPR
jgi:hypothetical protein